MARADALGVGAVMNANDMGADTMAITEERAREGWVLVPREPTEAMIEAMSDAGNAAGCSEWRMRSEMRAAYPAMLAAAPTPPTTDEARSVDVRGEGK